MSEILANLIIILILAAIVGAAAIYIYKEKKKGNRCIGCPAAGTCPRAGACHASSRKLKSKIKKNA